MDFFYLPLVIHAAIFLFFLNWLVSMIRNPQLLKMDSEGFHYGSFGTIPWRDILAVEPGPSAPLSPISPPAILLTVLDRSSYARRLNVLEKLYQQHLLRFAWYSRIFPRTGIYSDFPLWPNLSDKLYLSIITSSVSGREILKVAGYWIKQNHEKCPTTATCITKQDSQLEIFLSSSLSKVSSVFHFINGGVFALSGLFALGIGVFIMLHDVASIYDAYDSASWPSTTAIIQTSRFEKNPDQGDNSETFVFSYVYEVSGREFTNSAIIPGHVPNPIYNARSVAQYPVGTSHSVYYSPKNPSKAYLENGLHPHNFGGMIAGLLVATLGSTFIAVGSLVGGFIPRNRKLEGRGNFIAQIFKITLISFILLAVQAFLILWLS